MTEENLTKFRHGNRHDHTGGSKYFHKCVCTAAVVTNNGVRENIQPPPRFGSPRGIFVTIARDF